MGISSNLSATTGAFTSSTSSKKSGCLNAVRTLIFVRGEARNTGLVHFSNLPDKRIIFSKFLTLNYFFSNDDSLIKTLIHGVYISHCKSPFRPLHNDQGFVLPHEHLNYVILLGHTYSTINGHSTLEGAGVVQRAGCCAPGGRTDKSWFLFILFIYLFIYFIYLLFYLSMINLVFFSFIIYQIFLFYLLFYWLLLISFYFLFMFDSFFLLFLFLLVCFDVLYEFLCFIYGHILFY